MNKNFVFKRCDKITYTDKFGCKRILVADGWAGHTAMEFEDRIGKIIEIDRPFGYKLIYKRNILDEKEKKYLSAIVKPFKDKISCIRKSGTLMGLEEYIIICVKNEASMSFPNFKAGTMYKGMEKGKAYTLEELGIK